VDIAPLDIAILMVILLSAVIGLIRGLIKETLSLISWVAAFVLAIYFSSEVAAYLPQAWGTVSLRVAIAFAGLFVATLIAAAMAQWIIAKLVSSTGLSGTDRFLGLLFGGARGILICVVLLIGLREVAADRSWWQASILQAELLSFEDEVRSLLGKARDIVLESPVAAASIYK